MSILIFEHDEMCSPGRLGAVLLGYGYQLNIRRLWAGESPPPDLDDVEAVVCLSSPGSATALSGASWGKAASDLLRAAHARDLPVIGVGSGSLLVALAIGGAVEPLADGSRQVGWFESRMAFPGTVDTILSGQPWRAMQFVWQSEQVTRLPAGAAALAGTKACRNLMWRAGIRTYGIQHQFELDAVGVERWSRARSQDRKAAGVSHEQLMKATATNMPAFERLSERLCRCVADYLLPSPLRRCS